MVASDETVWVCAWTNGGAWIEGYAPADIPWGNEATDPEPPEPPEPPTPIARPKITIASYAPPAGEVPLSVTAIRAIDAASGPIEKLDWLWRDSGEASWIVAATNPPDRPGPHLSVHGAWHLRDRPAGGGAGGHGPDADQPRLVDARAEPPEPEPGPEPEPPVLAEGESVSMQCWDHTHYWCAEEGGGVEGDGCGRATASRARRSAAGSRSRRRPRRMGASASRRVDSGSWLCAEDTGALWFNRQREAGYVPGAWEAFTHRSRA